MFREGKLHCSGGLLPPDGDWPFVAGLGARTPLLD